MERFHKALEELDLSFELDELTEMERKEYALQASTCLSTKIFTHEIDRLVDRWTKNIALTAKDFDEVEGLRMSINALLMFREHIEELRDAGDLKQTLTDPHAGI